MGDRATGLASLVVGLASAWASIYLFALTLKGQQPFFHFLLTILLSTSAILGLTNFFLNYAHGILK